MAVERQGKFVIWRKDLTVSGIARKFGDDVNTDEIMPACYLNATDDAALAAHCMEGADPKFAQRARPGDIIVAGRNFGCGSSREHAPLAIKAFGISCIVAESYARIFFRNAINIGLPIVECAPAAAEADEGDEIEVQITEGRVLNHSKACTYTFPPYPEEIQRIIKAGGLIAFVKNQLAAR